LGASFGNIHIRDTAAGAVAEALRLLAATPAHVAGPEGSWVSVYPQQGDHDAYALIQVAGSLSERLDRPTIAFMVHDSDVFYYWLFDKGQLIDSYASDPGFFEGETRAPEGGRADVLRPFCVENISVESLELILHPDMLEDEDDDGFPERPYVFAEDQTRDLATCLGISSDSARAGFRYISKGGMPAGEVILQP